MGRRDHHWLIDEILLPTRRPLHSDFPKSAAEVARIEALIREHFDLRPAAIQRDLDLRRPIYAKTAAYGHFGRDDRDFTWERTDKADALRRAAGLAVAAPA